MTGKLCNFIELIQTDFINSELLITLTHLSPLVSFLRINAKRMYIFINENLYAQFDPKSQNIKMLILNVDNIYAYDSIENNEGFFNKSKSNHNANSCCPAAYSFFAFLVLTNLINSLDIIWINLKLRMNRNDLNKLIQEHLESKRKIHLYDIQFEVHPDINDEEEKKNDAH